MSLVLLPCNTLKQIFVGKHKFTILLSSFKENYIFYFLALSSFMKCETEKIDQYLLGINEIARTLYSYIYRHFCKLEHIYVGKNVI